MIIVLALILLCEVLLFFTCFNKRLTSISLWSSGMFLIASIAYIFNLSYFGADISGVTVITIALSPIFYSLGEVLAQRISIKTNKRNKTVSEVNDKQTSEYAPTFFFTILCTAFIILLGGYKFITMYRFASSKGLRNATLLVSYMRPYMVNGEYTNSASMSLMTSAAEAIAYIFSFMVIYNIVIAKKNRMTLTMPIFAYVILLVLSTGRTGFIKLIIVILGMVYVVMRQSNQYQVKIFLKFAKYVLLAGIILIAVFYVYGKVARGSQRTILEYFANYFSAGIFGLNDFLEHPWPGNSHFGEYTLSNYYYYINEFFHTDFVIPAHNLPFFRWVTSQSNIYTALVLPIQDFGIIGMLLTRILIGFIYSVIEKNILKSKCTEKHISLLIVLGLLLYCNFSVPIADRYVEFLTVTTFPSFLIFLYFINRMVIRNCNKKKRVRLLKRSVSKLSV